LAGQSIVNAGSTSICGSIGLEPLSSITDITQITMTCAGVTDVDNDAAIQAQTDLTSAYNQAATMGNGKAIPAGTYEGATTVLSGIYYVSASTLEVGGILTLDAQNNPNACFIFQIGTALNVDGSASVHLINGAQAANVFWAVGTSATLGTYSSFVGNIMTLASITLDTGATLEGRALAETPGSVSLNTVTITNP